MATISWKVALTVLIGGLALNVIIAVHNNAEKEYLIKKEREIEEIRIKQEEEKETMKANENGNRMERQLLIYQLEDMRKMMSQCSCPWLKGVHIKA